MRNLSKKIILIILLFIFFIILTNKSQSQVASNMSVLDSLINLSSKNICNYLSSKDIDSAIIKFPTHSAIWLIKQNILKSAENVNIKFYTKVEQKNLPEIDINIKECFIKYRRLETTNDSLIRIVGVDISATITKQNGSIINISPKRLNYKDIISRKDIVNINNSEYKFLNPEIPDKKRSFIENIIEPIIIVSSAILVVVLFFTVRSG